MMLKCGLCQVYTSSQMRILEVLIGEEPATNATELIQYCLNDMQDEELVAQFVESIDDTSTLCLGCYGKLLEIYRAIQVLDSVKMSVIVMLRNLGREQQKVDQEINETAAHAKAEDKAVEKQAIENSLDVDDCKEVEFLDDCSNIEAAALKEEELENEVQLIELENDDDEASCINLFDEQPLSENESQLNYDELVEEADEYIADEDTAANEQGQFEQVNEIYCQELELEAESLHSDFKKTILRAKRGTKLYTCDECQLDFTQLRQYRAHRKEAHKPGYVCDNCGKIFKSKAGFLAHRPLHKGTVFECKVCQRTFKLKVSLRRHMSYHSGETPFQCEVCNKSFAHRIALKTHKRIHLKDRDKECNVCQAKFLTNSHLKRHSLTHTGVRQHVCPICHKAFALAYNLRVHAREHHENTRTRSKNRDKKLQDLQDRAKFINLHTLAEEVLKRDELEMEMQETEN